MKHSDAEISYGKNAHWVDSFIAIKTNVGLPRYEYLVTNKIQILQPGSANTLQVLLPERKEKTLHIQN